MIFSFRKSLLTFVAMLVFSLVLMGTVFAHEGREIDGYELVFGWRSEPALVGYPNGPELFIRVHEEHEDEHEEGEEHEDEPANPLDGIEISLQVEVTFGPASTTLDLRQDFRDPSHYFADMIPTRPGDYSFRLFGMIGEMEIDEIFSSADGQFSSAEPASDITFPDDLPSMLDLLDTIEQLEARIEELESGD